MSVITVLSCSIVALFEGIYDAALWIVPVHACVPAQVCTIVSDGLFDSYVGYAPSVVSCSRVSIVRSARGKGGKFVRSCDHSSCLLAATIRYRCSKTGKFLSGMGAN